jgi:hypothetical protein
MSPRPAKTAVHVDLFRIQQTAAAGTFEKVYRWCETSINAGLATEHEHGFAWTVTVRCPDQELATFARDHMIGFGVPRSCVRLVAP